MTDCRSCGATILWAKTAKTGKAIPLDVAPVADDTPGALAVVAQPSVGLLAYGRTAVTPEIARAAAWHVAHFATCPNADAHRRPR